jgi:hypothetical protein
MTDKRLTLISKRIRELQMEIDSLEWEGLAPEKLADRLQELKLLEEARDHGELYIPNF